MLFKILTKGTTVILPHEISLLVDGLDFDPMVFDLLTFDILILELV